MCLAVPMKVVQVEGERGVVEQDGVRREVSFALVPQVSPGDYVLIHAGFAIERQDPAEAEETLALIREVERAASDRGEDS